MLLCVIHVYIYIYELYTLKYGQRFGGTTANWVTTPNLKKTKQEKLEHFQENEEAHEQAGFEKPAVHTFSSQEVAGHGMIQRQRRLFLGRMGTENSAYIHAAGGAPWYR